MNLALAKDKKINTVFLTENYDKFHFRDDNRIINKNHVRNLVEKMKAFGWIHGSQIKVNKSGDVIDGQHRLVAAKEVGIPVQYIVEEDTGFNEIQQLNQGQVNWNKGDHINAWIKKGNENYIILQEFLNEHTNFKVTEAIMLLMNEFTTISRADFENGLFEVKDRDVAEKWVGYLNSIKPYFEKGYNKSMFVRSIVKLLSRKADVFDFEVFLHKVELRPSMIYLCGSTEQYIEMIEELYNYRQQKKVNLRIFD